MKIIYWSDYACPYCYIGELRLKRAIREIGIENHVEIKSRAFEFDPDAPFEVQTRTDERFARKYLLSIDDARTQIEHISQLRCDEGIDFLYISTLYSNTRDSHRLTKLASDEGSWHLADKVGDLLFDAYFTRNEVLSDRRVLLRVATDAGMDSTKASATLDSNRYIDEVRYDEREAALRSIHAVPYFIIENTVTLPGAVNIRTMRNALVCSLRMVVAGEEELSRRCSSEGCSL